MSEDENLDYEGTLYDDDERGDVDEENSEADYGAYDPDTEETPWGDDR